MSCNRIHKGDLDAYVHGELSGVEAVSLESHLFVCQECAAELRHLRNEQRLFRMRAESDCEEAPPFEAVLARINGEARTSGVGDEDANRVVVFAKPVRPIPLSANAKVERSRAGEAKQTFPRWAQALVACAATAAAVMSFVGVTPPKMERMPVVHHHRNDIESGSDRVCTAENSSASGEILASMPPPRDVKAETPARMMEDVAACGASSSEQCGPSKATMENVCDEESAAMCGEGGP